MQNGNDKRMHAHGIATSDFRESKNGNEDATSDAVSGKTIESKSKNVNGGSGLPLKNGSSIRNKFTEGEEVFRFSLL